MTGATTITLPGGLWRDEARHRAATLRPLNGADELFLLEEGAQLEPAARASALLARCLLRLGPLPTPGLDAVRALTLGDREAMLLHLRRGALGEQMQALLICPGCGEQLDVDLRASDLLLPPYAEQPWWHEAMVEAGGRPCRMRFRLPTGADQELAAARLAGDAEGAETAVALLVGRCVDAADDGAGGAPPEGWEAAARAALPALMAALDPQAEIELAMGCPLCGHSFSSLFDTAGFLFAELAERAPQLYREIHLLAFHYHWAERAILGLTARKRRRYLELLAEELGEVHRR